MPNDPQRQHLKQSTGARLREVRLARRCTRAQMAGRDFSTSYIALIEQGKRNPSVPALKIMAHNLDMSSTQLLRLLFSRPLRVFLCHSSGDKTHVRNLCERLKAEGIEVWLDEKSLLAGQDWELEIRKTIRNIDVIIVCLTQNSITKVGFVQKEIRLALDAADAQPEGTIFLVPVRLEKCDLPERLKHLHAVNLFEKEGYELLLRALKSRADELELSFTFISLGLNN
ncbi:MAG: hypothetical protein NVSMB27_13810 [Ktedonobacteraceae bacterium]